MSSLCLQSAPFCHMSCVAAHWSVCSHGRLEWWQAVVDTIRLWLSVVMEYFWELLYDDWSQGVTVVALSSSVLIYSSTSSAWLSSCELCLEKCKQFCEAQNHLTGQRTLRDCFSPRWLFYLEVPLCMKLLLAWTNTVVVGFQMDNSIFIMLNQWCILVLTVFGIQSAVKSVEKLKIRSDTEEWNGR